MSLDKLDAALKSLDGWPNKIGIIGGEPTLHPQFSEVCALIRDRCAGRFVQLWTCGGTAYERYREEISATFAAVAFNDHSDPACRHQQITIASCDAVPNPQRRAELIRDCWVARLWCPSIGPKGAFFCEVACALDMLLDGPGGWPIEPGWWQREPKAYEDQLWTCQLCGMPVPMKTRPLTDGYESVSPTVYSKLQEHDCSRLDICKVVDLDAATEMVQPSENWTPHKYRPGV